MAVHPARRRQLLPPSPQEQARRAEETSAARGWQRTLAHSLSGGPDPGKQNLLWRTLQSYISMWGEQVDVHTPRISQLAAELSPHLTPQVWRACVRSAMADADDDLVAAHAQRWTHTWEALRSWFSGADGQARRLRRQLRDLVAPWARNTHILMDTGGAITRRSELLQVDAAIERHRTRTPPGESGTPRRAPSPPATC